jgi:hypothetical protein
MRLESKIGKQVRFRPPLDARKRGAQDRIGKIVDEVWAAEAQRDAPKHTHHDPNCWGNYAFCSQLIEWKDGGFSIRLAYYRQRCGQDHWEFASQTTLETRPITIKALMERTLQKADWFLKPECEWASD